jgi:hypothetical protein
MSERVYGLMAEFAEKEALLIAAQRAHERGYRRMDAYAPFPVDGLAEALGHRRTMIPLIVLIGALIGAVGGYFMIWYSLTIDYPLNVGGRPLHSWPYFIPVTFELAVLMGSLSAFFGAIALNRLPRPHHPVFNVPEFTRASTDRFFLCIETRDPQFDSARTADFLKTLKPLSVVEVPK